MTDETSSAPGTEPVAPAPVKKKAVRRPAKKAARKATKKATKKTATKSARKAPAAKKTAKRTAKKAVKKTAKKTKTAAKAKKAKTAKTAGARSAAKKRRKAGSKAADLKRLETYLRDISKEIDRAGKVAKAALARTEKEYERHLKDLRKRSVVVEKRVRVLAGKGDAAFHDLRSSVEKTARELQGSVQKAVKRFR